MVFLVISSSSSSISISSNEVLPDANCSSILVVLGSDFKSSSTPLDCINPNISVNA